MYEKLKVVQRCHYFKSLHVENITQTDINKNEDSLTKATVQGVNTFISMFFNFTYNRGYLIEILVLRQKYLK